MASALPGAPLPPTSRQAALGAAAATPARVSPVPRGHRSGSSAVSHPSHSQGTRACAADHGWTRTAWTVTHTGARATAAAWLPLRCRRRSDPGASGFDYEQTPEHGRSPGQTGAAGALHSQLCGPGQPTAGRQQAPSACQALPQGPQLREHRRGAAGILREPTAVRGKDATSSPTWRKLFPADLKRSEALAEGLFEPNG